MPGTKRAHAKAEGSNVASLTLGRLFKARPLQPGIVRAAAICCVERRTRSQFERRRGESVPVAFQVSGVSPEWQIGIALGVQLLKKYAHFEGGLGLGLSAYRRYVRLTNGVGRVQCLPAKRTLPQMICERSLDAEG